MLVEETFQVKSPTKKVFDSLLDPSVLGMCIPGCEKVERINEKEYHSLIKAKVGIIVTKFRVKSKITEIVPNSVIRTEGEGHEVRKLGQFKQRTEINFTELSEKETEVSYRSDVRVVGKLASFGDRVMKAKAKELGKDFAEAIKRKLE